MRGRLTVMCPCMLAGTKLMSRGKGDDRLRFNEALAAK
jgi:hypothetical protein